MWVLWAWVLLLVLSTFVRWRAEDPGVRAGQLVTMLPRMQGDSAIGGDPVRMAYRDSRLEGDSTVIVLLHGSPAASSFMMPLHQALRTGEVATSSGSSPVRIITPDLPGFEGSEKDIPDYSIRAHAAYLGAFLDSLGVSRVHLIGYSMGGGVAIEAMRQWPEHVASVTLLAGIGVQELELLGDHHLNRGIHGLQLAAIWGLTNLVPHFGALDDVMLGIPYARNFYDSDQRPLRNILSSWEKPLLILHGDSDGLVPTAAGQEHHRIVPHSKLILYPDVGHGLVVSEEDRISQDVLSFVGDVERGSAPTPTDVTPERRANSRKPFDPSDVPPARGFSLFILSFLIALATLVSEDLASITAGLMAARGVIPFGWALVAVFSGILVGDIGLYLMGRLLGRRIVTLPPFSWFVSAGALERGARWFEKRGAQVVVASRFIPGTRFPTYVAAGIIKAPFWRFLGYFALGTVLWTPVIVGVSMALGERILSLWEMYESVALWIVFGLILALYLVIHAGLPLFTYRGRRLWVSRWRRWTRWEFWPPWLFYPPVLVNVARLMVRHRSMTVFTAANPGMDSGGFVGESKAQALSLLPEASGIAARWLLVDPGDSEDDQTLREHVKRELSARNMAPPLVLKPDVGERGHGVHIVRSREELFDAIRLYPAAFIIQEFVEGEEFGLFYVRHPAEECGTLISITHKVLLSATGNGQDSLERLILSHPRAVCMAPTFLNRHAARLDHVPAKGESIALVSVGTHSRGALFKDGAHLMTPQLEHAVDHFASRMHGFHFGRFDVRVPSAAHLERGEGIRILEINGVSSESTHIYDPSTRLKVARRTLAEQWRMAFEIGRANVDLGASPTPLSRLVRLIIAWKIRPSFRPDPGKAAEWSLHSGTAAQDGLVQTPPPRASPEEGHSAGNSS